VHNGILKLKTRQLQQITPEVMVSKRISVSFDLTAQYRMWMCFLSDLQPDMHNLKIKRQGEKPCLWTQTC